MDFVTNSLFIIIYLSFESFFCFPSLNLLFLGLKLNIEKYIPSWSDPKIKHCKTIKIVFVIRRKLCFEYAVPCWFLSGGVYLLETSRRISSYSNIIHQPTSATCSMLPTSCAHRRLTSFLFSSLFRQFTTMYVFLQLFFISLVLVSEFACTILLECKCQLK